jgi:hypothetical protein
VWYLISWFLVRVESILLLGSCMGDFCFLIRCVWVSSSI